MSWKGRQKQTAPAALGKVLSAALDAGARAADPPMLTASDLGAPPVTVWRFDSAYMIRAEALKRAIEARQGNTNEAIITSAKIFEAYLAGETPAAGEDEDPKAGEPRGA